MPIKDASNLPDDRVPEWVRESRERARLRKGPAMEDYRERLRKYGPPPVYTVAERLAVLAAGLGARIEPVARDTVRVTVEEAGWDSVCIQSSAAILGVRVELEEGIDNVLVYRIYRLEER
jgi:hypothetical protein